MTKLEVVGVLVQIIGSVLGRLPEELVCRVLLALQDLHVGPGKCQTPEIFQKFANVRKSSGFPLTVCYV